ncbi:hypothetical protein BU055_02170 [Staphylococcus succinus]|uniref:hypothetical protein n=1 Tax=Staphylococcus succinus TaxID=61015 RepID=UPI000D1F02C2|nr:hypothetical protein [Staphylococcus succinus]PTJ85114.1 hypothetical protein BU055_02170 [Staphylococcus succinus]
MKKVLFLVLASLFVLGTLLFIVYEKDVKLFKDKVTGKVSEIIDPKSIDDGQDNVKYQNNEQQIRQNNVQSNEQYQNDEQQIKQNNDQPTEQYQNNNQNVDIDKGISISNIHIHAIEQQLKTDSDNIELQQELKNYQSELSEYEKMKSQ